MSQVGHYLLILCWACGTGFFSDGETVGRRGRRGVRGKQTGKQSGLKTLGGADKVPFITMERTLSAARGHIGMDNKSGLLADFLLS